MNLKRRALQKANAERHRLARELGQVRFALNREKSQHEDYRRGIARLFSIDIYDYPDSDVRQVQVRITRRLLHSVRDPFKMAQVIAHSIYTQLTKE